MSLHHLRKATDEERAAAFREARTRILEGSFDYGRHALMSCRHLAHLSGLSTWKLQQVLNGRRGLSYAELDSLTMWLCIGLESKNAALVARLARWAEAQLKNPIVIDEHARAVLKEVHRRAAVICLPGDELRYW